MSPRNAAQSETINFSGLAYLYSRGPFLIHHVDQITRAIYRQEQFGEIISQPQYVVLNILACSGDLSQTVLARLGGIDTSTLSALVGRLLAKKLIHRASNADDRREKLVAITDTGRAALADAARAYNLAQQRLLAIGDIGPTRFIELIGRVAREPDDTIPEWQPVTAAPGLATMFASPAFLLRRLLQRSDTAISRSLGYFNMTTRQYSVLLVLLAYESLTEATLRRFLGYDASNTALVVNVLVAKGLAVVTNPQTRKRARYRATYAGRALLADKEPALRQAEATLFQSLAVSEIVDLKAALCAVILTHSHVTPNRLEPFDTVIGSPEWRAPRFEP